MEERRKTRRKFIIFYTRIFDAQTMDLVGHLGDITPEGAMVISRAPFPVDQLFQFKVELSDEIAEQDYLSLNAHSLWSERDVDPNLFNTGFALQGVSPEDRAIIAQILEKYGIRDV